MINEYHCPDNLEEAFNLFSNIGKRVVPMGGGTVLSQGGSESVNIVDLKKLGMDHIGLDGNFIRIGGVATLSSVENHDLIPETMKIALEFESTQNIRNQATIAGAIICGDGRSVLSSYLLAVNAGIRWIPSELEISFGEWLAARSNWTQGIILSAVKIPTNVYTAIETIGRSPRDIPIINVVISQWLSGRTRIVLGGFGEAPKLIVDGLVDDHVTEASKAAFFDAGDQWASAEYRSEMAGILTARLTNILPK